MTNPNEETALSAISARLPATVASPNFGPALGPLLDQLNSRFASKSVTLSLKPDGSVLVHLPKRDAKLRQEVRDALPPGIKTRFVVDGKKSSSGSSGPSGPTGFGPALGPLVDQIAARFSVRATLTSASSVTVFLPSRSAAFEAQVRAAFPPGVSVSFQVQP
jgi:hypothetical protein